MSHAALLRYETAARRAATSGSQDPAGDRVRGAPESSSDRGLGAPLAVPPKQGTRHDIRWETAARRLSGSHSWSNRMAGGRVAPRGGLETRGGRPRRRHSCRGRPDRPKRRTHARPGLSWPRNPLSGRSSRSPRRASRCRGLQPSVDADRRPGRRSPAPHQPSPEGAPGFPHNSPIVVTRAAARPRATGTMPKSKTMKPYSWLIGEMEPPAS